jgi:glutathione synthase
MIDVLTNKIKLVEYNTIASSFGPLSQTVSIIQDYVYNKYFSEADMNYTPVDLTELHPMHRDGKTYIERHIHSYKQAIDFYKQTMPNSADKVWILYVVAEDERNVIDQKKQEFELQVKYGIPSMRVTFTELAAEGKVDETTGVLSVYDNEVALVYFRTGYDEDNYCKDGLSGREVDEEKWKMRTMLECSMAIKCPSIDVQLATFKKF